MSNLPPFEELVQSLVSTLRDPLKPILDQVSMVSLLREDDRVLRDAMLQASCRLLSEAWTEQQRPANAVAKQPYRWHTALGVIEFTRYAVRDADQRWVDPVPDALLRSSCTVAVREQICTLHARLTNAETREAMLLFVPQPPSLSTIQRVAVADGERMAEEFTPLEQQQLLSERVAPIASQVSLIVLGADGGHAPMRSDPPSGSREWHEGRVVSITLLGDPISENPRKVTLLDSPRGEVEVGLTRPVLATLSFAQMPTLQGPKSDRVQNVLSSAYKTMSALIPQAQWQGVSDGGAWPESTLEQVLGASRCTTDFMHASEHLLDASKAIHADASQAESWWKKQRTRLLMEPDGAADVTRTLQWYAARANHCVDPKSLRTECGYFVARVNKMDYADRLKANQCIGSGHIESAVKCTIGVRLKRPGATWSHEGGDATLHVRSLLLSGMWDSAWNRYIDRQFLPYERSAA